MIFDLVTLTIWLFFTCISTHWFSDWMKNSPYGYGFWGVIVWGFENKSFKALMLGGVSIFAMVLTVLSLFHRNSMSTPVLVIISISSLILTIACSYVFIKGLRNPPVKNIIFQCVIFILLGLYTMVLSVLKMYGITLWLK